jgi:lipopolysaccharide export system protein LptC
MSARLNQTQGPVLIVANQGRYNLDTQQVAIDGAVKVAGGDGFRLNTSDVTVDLKQRQLASKGPAVGAMRLGQFRANRIQADLGDHKVVMDGGVRLKIVQGAVR